MATLQEAYDKIGDGISLNAFTFEFEHESTMLLDKLLYLKKIQIVRSKKHQVTVVMPK